MRTSLCMLTVVCACGGTTQPGDDVIPDLDAAMPMGSSDPLDGLPTGVAQWTNLCAKGYGDMISAKFCAGSTPPTINSLAQLQQLLGLVMVPNPTNNQTINPGVRITFTGFSTGLGLRSVTPLNPRAFVMTTPRANGTPNPTFQVLAFNRGEAFVELVANDPQANTLRFFLLRFHPACEATAAGCNFADLLTPTIESGWTDYTIYDDATINNTTLDCMNCHQAGGPGTAKTLRMQELANPWMHWFYIEHPSNMTMMGNYHAAHGTADYANIPGVNIDPSRPFAIQGIVTNNGFGTQPNAFDTKTIETEVAASSHATWDALYAKSVAGTELPTPYFATPTDPAKLSAMIAAYQQTIAGTLPRDQMPDIRDTLLDSALADMSIRPKPGLDGRGILGHMCQMCHNSKLDQSITRARFNVENYAGMTRFAKDEAIRRLQLPDSDAKHMPPTRFHVLSDAERELVIDELSK